MGIKEVYKDALNDCWKHNKEVLKGYEVKKENLEDYLSNLDCEEEFDDLYWYAGFLAGLRRANNQS